MAHQGQGQPLLSAPNWVTVPATLLSVVNTTPLRQCVRTVDPQSIVIGRGRFSYAWRYISCRCIVTDMNALDLFQLGRWLQKIGEEAMRTAGAAPLAPGVRLILMNVFASPDSSINEIADQTGLPQSYVSESVGKLRDQGVFETHADPADGRRSLVRVSKTIPKRVAQIGLTSVDDVLLDAFGEVERSRGAELVAALEVVAAQLRTTRSGSRSMARRLAEPGTVKRN
jgi:DNA-binding MarR family transcriptional regulator